MPRGELAPQEIPDQSLQLPDSTTKEEQLEAIDLAVEKTTDAFLETQDTEGPPPLPEEYLAAFEASEKLKKEKADEEDFLNRDPNVIRARANYNRVDAEMLALGIAMTESPDANKRAQAKRKYEKMCGVGLNNPKNGEFNLAINALHRAEDRSREKRLAMKKMHEAQVAQTALDKKMNDVGAIEKQLGIGAVPPTELAEVSHLMRDAVAANTDAEIAEEKVGEPDAALESQITLAQQEARAAGDRNLTSEAIQKKVGELQRAATMNFMVPQDRMMDVKFLRSTYNEALAFVTKLSEFKNGIEAQNLTDTQKINIYQSIDAAHDALDLQLGRIGDALKTAEKNDFHEQSLSATPSGERQVRTAVGLNRGLSQEQDRYAASDWMQKEEDYAPPAVQKPKKGFFGSFGAKVAGGLAGLAAAFTFGSSRAPERTVAPNFTQPENVHMGDSEHHDPLHFVDTLRNAAPQTVTELPDIRIKAGGRSVASPDVRRVHPDHPIVQRTMEKIDNEIAPTVVFAPGSETERRVDEEVRKAMVPIDAAINSATPDAPKIFPVEGEEHLAPQEKKEDPLSIVPPIEAGATELAGKHTDEAPATGENMVEPVGEAPQPAEEVVEGDSGIDTDETEGGTAEMDSNTKNKKGRLPGYLEKPLQELGDDITRSMNQIDRDNDRFAAQTQEYLNKKAEASKDKKKTVSFKSIAKTKSKGKSGKASKPLTREQKARVQVAANETLKPIEKILNQESKPGINLFGSETEPSKITDLPTAKRAWQDAVELLSIARETGQDPAMILELERGVETAKKVVDKLDVIDELL